MIALILRRKLRCVEVGLERGYLLQSGLHDSPNTILVTTSFHELKATPKSGQTRISVWVLELCGRYSRHITHEIRAKIRRQNDDMVAGSGKASRKIVQPSSHVQHNALLAIRSLSEVLETANKLSGTLRHDNFVLFQRCRRKCSIPCFALVHVFHGVALSKQRRCPWPAIPS